MADSIAFTTVCDELEQRSSLARLEARGTIRIALKQAGLDARSVTASQLSVVVDKILPAELETRGISDGATICGQLASCLSSISDEAASESPEAVFQRLGGS